MGKTEKQVIIIPFSKVTEKEDAIVGEKATYLSRLYSLKIPVPNGFIITTNTFNAHIFGSKLHETITKEITGLDPSDTSRLENVSGRIRRAFFKTPIDKEIEEAIKQYYSAMSGFSDSYVAIRSSLPQTESQNPYYTGQYETFLNVQGKKNVVEKVKETWASLYCPQSIFYALSSGLDPLDLSMAVIVQKMIQSEVSGIMFTSNPIDNDASKISIEAVLGLGEALIQGQLTPDTYLVEKEDYKIIDKHIIPQDWMLVRRGRAKKGEDANAKVNVSTIWKTKQKLENKYIEQLAKIGNKVESKQGTSQEIEWAYEGGRLWIVQTKPMTSIEVKSENLWKSTPTFAALKAKTVKKAASQKKVQKQEKFEDEKDLEDESRVLLSGSGANNGIVSGVVRIIQNEDQFNNLSPGDIAVIKEVPEGTEKKLHGVVGIITDHGGVDSYAIIAAQKLGVPAIIDTQIGTKILREGEKITLNGNTGEVLSSETQEGILQAQRILHSKKIDPDKVVQTKDPQDSYSIAQSVDKIGTLKTATKVYVNINESKLAATLALSDVSGVSYADLDYVLLRTGIHPRLLQSRKKDKNKVVSTLALELFKIAKSFDPRPIIYRLSNFLSTDYLKLGGASEYEIEEQNPLLGMHGARRYCSASEDIAIELEAIKNVRNKENLKNVAIAIPFVRTFKELQDVKRIISAAGFRRSSTFKLFIIAQVPSAVIEISRMLEIGIDGVIIDLDALTQTILSIDKTNTAFAEEYSVSDPAVLWAVETLINECNKAKVFSQVRGRGLAGDGALIRKIIQWGATSIAVNPDVLQQTYDTVHEAEGSLLSRKSR